MFISLIMQVPIYLFFSFMLLVSGCSNAPGDIEHPNINQYFDQNWAMNQLWDDGKAEVAQYDAIRSVYGKPRKYEFTHILVKEDFNKEYNVKTDDYRRKDLFAVMKVNAFARIETDNYPYHYLASWYYLRENPLILHKATVSSQEWCGNTFKAFNNSDKGFEYKYDSYWDTQGKGMYQMEGPFLFEDQLSYSFRALKFKDGLIFQYPIVESQIHNKASKPAIYDATITVSAFGNHWKVVVDLDSVKQNEYIFNKDYPNILLSQKTWDGRTMELKSNERKAYWINDSD